MSSLENINIQFSPPDYLTEHFYISGIIALISNLFVSYLLVVKGNKLETFRYYLLLYQAFCAIGDVHLSILMQPIGLFPICAGYSNGLLKLVNVPVDVQMTVLSFLASCQVNTLNICFIKKHRSISSMSQKFRMRKISFQLSTFILSCYPFIFSGAFFMSSIPRDEQFRVILQDYPYFYRKFQVLEDFQLYVMNFWMNIYFFLAIIGCIQSGFTIGFSVLQMIRTLHEVKTLISKTTWNKHKVAVRNLIIQLQSSLVGIVPAVSIAFVVLIPTDFSQTLSYFFTMVVAMHSTVNVIVMLLTYPELRKNALFWRKKEASTISVSINVSSVAKQQTTRSIT